MDFWRALFNKEKEGRKGKVGGPLSDEQCYAAREIFGEAVPEEVDRACGRRATKDIYDVAKEVVDKVLAKDIKDVARELVDKVLASDDIMAEISRITQAIEEIAAGIAELKRFQREYETDKSMWQARGSAMFGANDITRQLAAYGQKTGSETEPDDFVSIANKLAAKSVKRPKNQHISHSLTQGWYKRSWFG